MRIRPEPPLLLETTGRRSAQTYVVALSASLMEPNTAVRRPSFWMGAGNLPVSYLTPLALPVGYIYLF